MIVKSSVTVLLAGALVLFSSGCATKNYVRQQTQPIIDKANELDALTAKNTNGIRDVDTRAQQGIQGVNQKTSEADQKAVDERTPPDHTQTLPPQAPNPVDP